VPAGFSPGDGPHPPSGWPVNVPAAGLILGITHFSGETDTSTGGWCIAAGRSGEQCESPWNARTWSMLGRRAAVRI
jgi:hypothetical protein